MNSQAVADKIFELFDVSREDASSYATEFMVLVSSFSGVQTPDVIERQIPKIFGGRLKWRDESKREANEKKSKAIFSAYNAFINGKRS